MSLIEIWALELERHGFARELCALFDALKRDDSAADKLLHRNLPVSLCSEARCVCNEILEAVLDNDADAHRRGFERLKQFIVTLKNLNGQ
jgi:hypothetical protein